MEKSVQLDARDSCSNIKKVRERWFLYLTEKFTINRFITWLGQNYARKKLQPS